MNCPVMERWLFPVKLLDTHLAMTRRDSFYRESCKNKVVVKLFRKFFLQ